VRYELHPFDTYDLIQACKDNNRLKIKQLCLDYIYRKRGILRLNQSPYRIEYSKEQIVESYLECRPVIQSRFLQPLPNVDTDSIKFGQIFQELNGKVKPQVFIVPQKVGITFFYFTIEEYLRNLAELNPVHSWATRRYMQITKAKRWISIYQLIDPNDTEIEAELKKTLSMSGRETFITERDFDAFKEKVTTKNLPISMRRLIKEHKFRRVEKRNTESDVLESDYRTIDQAILIADKITESLKNF
jgi:hypothetical protein